MSELKITIQGREIHDLDGLFQEIISSVEAGYRIYKYRHSNRTDFNSIHIEWDQATNSLENIPNEFALIQKYLNMLTQKYQFIKFTAEFRQDIILEGNCINSIQDFHRKIAALLEFPDFYGENLNALWDLMTGHTDTNIRLIWKDSHYSQMYLGEGFKDICELFNDVAKAHPEFRFEAQ